MTKDYTRAITWTGVLAVLIATLNLLWTIWWSRKLRREDQEDKAKTKKTINEDNGRRLTRMENLVDDMRYVQF